MLFLSRLVWEGVGEMLHEASALFRTAKRW